MKVTPFQSGDPKSKICLLGQAPASEEMRLGEPFVGPAGSVLNECLHSAGLIRAEVSIANVCRGPMSNDAAEKTFLSKSGLTELGHRQMLELQGRLEKEGFSPVVIIPTGNVALTMACGKRAISKHRGSIYPSSLLPETKVIGTWHPASTLPGRGPYVNRYTIVKDLKRAIAQSDSREIRRPERTLRIYPTFQEVHDYISHLRYDVHRATFDIETTNRQVSCLSLACDPSFGMSIPFWGDVWTLEQEASIWKALAGLFADEHVVKIGQNICTFDIPFLMMRNHIHFAGEIRDTMVMHRILYPDFPAKLEFLCSYLTEEPYYKDDRKLWTNPSKDLDTFFNYNAKDSVVTDECERALYPLVMADSYRATYEMTMNPLYACLGMTSRGIKADRKGLLTEQRRVRIEIASKQEELNTLAGEELNVASPKQMKEYFYGKKKFTPYVDAKSGKPTCNDKAMFRIYRKYNCQEARIVQEIRGLRTLVSRYLEVELDKDSRLRCVYDVRGTSTGRLSSKKTPIDTGTNNQNLDPRFKHYLKPGE